MFALPGHPMRREKLDGLLRLWLLIRSVPFLTKLSDFVAFALGVVVTSDPAPDVLGVRHQFKVFMIHTRSISAQMIQFKSVRYRTMMMLENNTVRHLHLAVSHLTIPVVQNAAFKDQASVFKSLRSFHDALVAAEPMKMCEFQSAFFIKAKIVRSAKTLCEMDIFAL